MLKTQTICEIPRFESLDVIPFEMNSKGNIF